MDVAACVPTIGTTFTVAEVLADPIDTNTELGHYTHFGNLLDLVAVAVPAGTTADGRPASRCCSARPGPMTSCSSSPPVSWTNRETDRDPMPSPIRSP